MKSTMLIKRSIQSLREKAQAEWKEIVTSNCLEGLKLNLFGGSIRENIEYLKSLNGN